MASKYLYHILIFRVVLMVLTSIGFAYLSVLGYYDYLVVVGLLLTIEVASLIHYLNKVNRKIAYFFNAIENEDSTVHFPENIELKSIKELNASLNGVNKLIQKVKIENLAQEKYFHTIIEQAAIGLLTIDTNGHIMFANSSAKKTLNSEVLTHISQLKRIDEKLFSIISNLKPFEERLIKLPNEREEVELTIKATSLKLEDKKLLLVVIQNIRNELDAKEVDSWIGLIRVLTHEIMNSVAPITSLSETLEGVYKNENGVVSTENLSEKDIENTVKGLEIIKNQGINLIDFVSSYRSLTKIPAPEKELLSVPKLFERIQILVSQEEGFNEVKFELQTTPDELEVFADENQLTQVLVNLVKNAIQSLANSQDGKIKLIGMSDDYGNVLLTVSDNGPGIASEILDNIFIPFFTTREKGTGIGLSLSKHIMRLHHGTLKVHSTVKETRFILKF